MEELIELVGAKEIAARTGVSLQVVYKWKYNGVPPRRAIQLQELFGVKATKLCPLLKGVK